MHFARVEPLIYKAHTLSQLRLAGRAPVRGRSDAATSTVEATLLLARTGSAECHVAQPVPALFSERFKAGAPKARYAYPC